MPSNLSVAVKDLSLDLRNSRTVPQKNESSALHAMVSLKPEWFWALTESLLADGYHPTENILVLNDGQKMTVREGNRRIGALKLILGIVKNHNIDIPTHIETEIGKVSKEWKAANSNVPCAIYSVSESALVDKIVTLTHAKGEQAGRNLWNSVARARYNRDKGGTSEPALDLLEKYLKEGKNLNALQAERWAGDYQLTVLNEAIKRIAPRFSLTSSRELADQYPKVKFKSALDDILRDIGVDILGFNHIRSETEDFALRYGIPQLTQPNPQPGGANPTQPTGSGTGGTGSGGGVGTGKSRKPRARSSSDSRAVKQTLRNFVPRGANRNKVTTLLEEAKSLKLKYQPHAFCFLLRSMFEISAKAYCLDNKSSGCPGFIDPKTGRDRSLIDILKDIYNHMTVVNGVKNVPLQRVLHGAMAELKDSHSVLSVTSMNQLVHNPKFTVDETHISNVFGNVFPLLEQLNK